MPIDDRERPVLDRLGQLAIGFERHEHPPVFTVDEAEVHWAAIDATHCKNLFLRNKKGATHYLIVVGIHKTVDLRALTAALGEDRLSFGSPERLMTHLGLTPGSVSPFGLIHDEKQAVRVVLDADLESATRVGFHPNVNTATVVVSWADFRRFLTACGNVVRVVRM